ncbi:MAG: OmpA family protein [Chitinophagaceae bacterium]
MKKLLSTLALALVFAGTANAQNSLVMPNNETQQEKPTLEYKIEGNEVRTGNAVSFAKNSAEILPESDAALNTIKKFLEDKSYISLLRVEGHVSCGKGDQGLSEARALAVCKWLVAQGVDCKRLLPVGFGCTKPITDANNEMNERITFVNAALKGHAIGGMPVDGGGKVAESGCE